MSYNRVILLGNLTRDPEIKYTPKGTAIADLGIAVNRKYTADNDEKREEVTFVDVTFWAQVAETIGKYCTKGKQVLIEGRLQLDTWDDKTTGQKRSKLKVVGENIQFLGGGERKEGEPKDWDEAKEQAEKKALAPAIDLDDDDQELPM